MLCGTDPLPELFRAKRYKIKQKFLTKSEFQFIMRNLPEEVSEADIEEMFDVADTDKDGKIGFQVTRQDYTHFHSFITDVFKKNPNGIFH